MINSILDLPDGQEIRLREIVKHVKDGRDSVSNGINELIALGYIVRGNVRSNKGAYSACNYSVIESPQKNCTE